MFSVYFITSHMLYIGILMRNYSKLWRRCVWSRSLRGSCTCVDLRPFFICQFLVKMVNGCSCCIFHFRFWVKNEYTDASYSSSGRAMWTSLETLGLAYRTTNTAHYCSPRRPV